MKALGLIVAALIFSAPAVASAQSAAPAGKVWSHVDAALAVLREE